MKIAIAQINPIVGNIQANKEKIIEQISIAKAAEAQLVVFGELAICGSPTYDLVVSEDFIEKSLFAVSEIAEYVRGIDVLIGTPTETEGDVFNTILHISNGEILGEYSKAMITSREEMGNFSGIESEYFPEGEMLENIITVDGEKFLLAIGGDIEFIEQLDIFEGLINIRAVINPMAARYSHYVGHEMAEELQRIAQKISTPIINANLVGANTDIIYFKKICLLLSVMIFQLMEISVTKNHHQKQSLKKFTKH